MTLFSALSPPLFESCPPAPGVFPAGPGWLLPAVTSPRAAGDEDEEEELGDEEDLAVTQPAADEDSAFEDFDDEFDDDFEEEENDPDWDHPEDGDSDEPPPSKGPGRKK